MEELRKEVAALRDAVATETSKRKEGESEVAQLREKVEQESVEREKATELLDILGSKVVILRNNLDFVKEKQEQTQAELDLFGKTYNSFLDGFLPRFNLVTEVFWPTWDRIKQLEIWTGLKSEDGGEAEQEDAPEGDGSEPGEVSGAEDS